jgi:predicted site-specific integrase-resolvase
MFLSLANRPLIEYPVPMKLSSYAKKLGIHYNTAYRMFRRGEIAGYQLPTGTVIIEESASKTALPDVRGHLTAVYAGVSSGENKQNLDTQAEQLITWYNAKGWSVSKVVKEAGSGINDQHPKFLALLSNKRSRGLSWSIKTAPPVSGWLSSRFCFLCKGGSWWS